MLDLPLSPGASSEDSLPGFPPAQAPPKARPKRGSRERGRRKPGRPPSKKKRALIAVLGALALVAAYFVFWPKPPQAAFSPLPFSSGPQRVSIDGDSKEISISNIGERPMAISLVTITDDPGAEFELIQDSCSDRLLEPQQSCVAEVVFSPGEMGERAAALEVHAEMPDSPARLELTGVGVAPLVALSPPTLSFGSQDVATTSEAKTITVSNSGTAPLEIEGLGLEGGGAKDFRRRRDKCSNQTLQPESDCTVQFVFAPRAAGARSVELRISSDALHPPPALRISGEGIWTGAAFAVDPKDIHFGDHLVGSSQERQRVVVTNRQSSALRGLEVELVGENAGFSVTKESCSGRSIAPGESCEIHVGFAAPEEGDFNALLQLGNDRFGLLGLEIEGRGVSPRWVLSTDALDLGEVRVGSKSDLFGVELANEGSAAAKVSKVELIGADAKQFKRERDSCTGKSIEPGRSCLVEIAFLADREGPHYAEVRMYASAGNSPQTFVLSALAAAPRLSLDLEMAEFGQVHRTTLQELIVTASNPGTAPLQLESFAVEGESAGSFRILGGTCFPQATVPPRQRCTIRIGFDPVAEGRGTARLEIQHDGFSGPKSVPLSGTGLPPPSPEIYLSTRRLDFGPQSVGDRSPILTVTISSAGTGQLRFEDFVIDGGDAGSFQIVPATCHAVPSLLPGSSCAVGVRMTPAGAGPKKARLVVRHNAGPRVSIVDLVGEGLGGGQ